MNALAQQLLGVCKGYLGPAAPAFLHRELREVGTDANRVEARQLAQFAETAMIRAEPLMGPAKAAALRTALLHCGELARPAAGDSRLANDAAGSLLTKGRAREAAKAFRELATKHGDVASYRGLAKALLLLDERDGAVQALREGAALRLKRGDRAGELELLADAVVAAPVDLAVHRRLAAALANHGDLAGACDEYGRFIDAALELGDTRRAWLELAYGREILGELPPLLAIVDRITVRSAPEPGGAVDHAKSGSARRNEPIDLMQRAARRRGEELETVLAGLVPAGPPQAAAAIAYMRATVLIAARDPRATDATLAAARQLLALDRPRAAADALLAYINAGFRGRDAHLVLAEAIRRLGRSDLAEDKCRLLATLHRLDGDVNAAGAAESAALAARANLVLAGASA